MTRRALAPSWLLVGVVAMVAGCSSAPASHSVAAPTLSIGPGTTTATPSDASAPTQPSAWEQVQAQIRPDGTVTADTALQAFSLAFGPLPGVQVPSGPVGEIRSGSGAVRWLVGHWDEITAAQRTEAVRLVPELAGVGGGAPANRSPQPAVQLASYHGPAPAPVRPPTYYAVLAQTMADEIEAHVGIPMLLTLFAAEGRTELTTSAAETVVLDAGGGRYGTSSKCIITVSAAGAAQAQIDIEDMMAHEVWHCYQGQIRGLDWYYSAATPSWLVEGQAEWVGDAIRPAANAAGPWEGYISKPGKALFERSYDALGFYAHLTQSGVNTWDALIPMLQAADDNVARYEASGATSDQFLDTWASSFFREPAAGAAWDLEGPGLPAARGAVRIVLSAANGKATSFSAPAYANHVFDLSSTADILSFTIEGHARLADTANGQDYVLAGGSFCTKDGGCICPPGTDFVGVPPNRLSAETLLAVTGGPTGTHGVATGHSMEEFCKPTAACSVDIPPGTYDGTLTYSTITPYITHRGDGPIQFTVDGEGGVAGSWDLAYVATSSTGEIGSGEVKDGVVAGSPHELLLSGTNTTATSHGTIPSVVLPWPHTPLAVQPVCDGQVVARFTEGALTVTVHASAKQP